MLARIRKSAEEKDQGFTLIELLVVIIIIGILAAIAIPVFLRQREKGWDSQAKSDARNLATLEETWFTDANYYVVGTAAGTPLAITNLSDYKPSANVTAVVIKGYSAGTVTTPDVTTGTTGVAGFCVQTTSKSGNTFAYDSLKGGLRPGTSSTC
jgi:type IV pilus assembly protein PilA